MLAESKLWREGRKTRVRLDRDPTEDKQAWSEVVDRQSGRQTGGEPVALSFLFANISPSHSHGRHDQALAQLSI